MPRSDKECKKIGIQMAHGEVFHSVFIHNSDMVWALPAVFLPVAFLNDKQREDFAHNGYVAIYAHMSEALTKSINGYPSFRVAKYLTKEEDTKVVTAFGEEVARMRELEDDDSEAEDASSTVGAGRSTDGDGSRDTVR